jgi:hypothetical protein
VNPPEFSRPVDVRQVEGKHMRLVASAAECAALARRFAIVRIDRLEAELTLKRTGQGAEARGQLDAAIIQNCATSDEDFPVAIGEAVAQSLALAINPFATGPGADDARRRAGIIAEGSNGPFAALGSLLSKQ